MKKRVLSGIQPSGELHLGNYLGALRRWVEVQEEWDCIYCIVDLHAITVPRDPKVLRKTVRDLAALYFAAGIDPEKSRVFVQSHVQEHAELAWILNCLIPLGWLKRMTQFKDKAGVKQDQVSAGLFVYPGLMAADILLYQAQVVPVGEDQKQHVELTRDVARMFNSRYGEVFTIPEPHIAKTGARIMGLDDPSKKMAKTDASPNRCIYLLDSPEVIRKKISRAATDSLTEIRFDKDRPGVNNLLTIYQLLSGRAARDIEEHFAGKMYSHLKKELGELVVESLRPLQEKYYDIIKDPVYLDELLAQGADAVRPIARKTLRGVKSLMGLL
jgi:tryptophanyl-tRNA synthetase